MHKHNLVTLQADHDVNARRALAKSKAKAWVITLRATALLEVAGIAQRLPYLRDQLNARHRPSFSHVVIGQVTVNVSFQSKCCHDSSRKRKRVCTFDRRGCSTID